MATRAQKAAPAASQRSAAGRAAASKPKKRAAAPAVAKKRGASTGAVERNSSARDAPAGDVDERLAKYRSMRDFGRTPEPAGDAAAASPEAGLSFVVQKHAASHLHYDFRLELDGALLSWSVPKGPSMRPGERRLAVRTEDHPLSYADFEGIIPAGEYGGGTVLVWDRGSWAAPGDAKKAVAQGKLTFVLLGEKLKGRFHLARTKGDGRQEHWLLFKGKDEYASAGSDVVGERPESVLSGRTIEEIAGAPARVWHSNRPAHTHKGGARTRADAPAAEPVRAGEGPTQPRADVVALVKRLPLKFALTNLEKVLYPEQNLRKAELIAFYASVASFALPYLGQRPLMIVRCPNGPHQHCFYQKHANDGVPGVVQRVPVTEEDGSTEFHMAVRDMEGLVALAQLGALEVHTWMCHADDLERPDQFVFDIDPDEGLRWEAVVEAAFALRARLAELELESFLKTTGGKGLHVVVPVARKLDWEQHKAFAKGVAESLARERPDRYLTSMRKSARRGRLFLDYLRNGRGSTAIAPFSTRARAGATVATPISWQELEHGIDPRAFTVHAVTKRLGEQRVDPWKDYLKTKQSVSVRALRAMGVPKQ